MVNKQTSKHIEAKSAINALNEFLRKQIEVINESFNVIMCYCFLLLGNLVTDRTRRDYIGYTLLLAAGILIGVNTIFLINMIY